ncbi:MAG: acyl-CoA dehydrogenase N-terminal domain-containing protein, partial [Pseudomonadota bacterium]|nr:acyl-CoA dehydrogenase N-terminal domain-containing protein [Pseudomonadota bacterium]
MSYQAPIRDLAFCLDHIVGADRLAETELFADAAAETRAAILDEAGKLAAG